MISAFAPITPVTPAVPTVPTVFTVPAAKNAAKPGAVTITYCRPCGFAASAINTAAALRMQLGLDADLVSRKNGIFQVSVNGKAVARKTGDGFPEEKEILSAVAAALEMA